MKTLLTAKFTITAISFFFYMLGNSFFDLIPIHLETIEMTKKQIGFLMSFSGLGGFTMLPLLAVIIDRVNLKNLLRLSLVLLLISQSLYFSKLTPYPFFIIPLFIRGAFMSLFMISFMTMISHFIPAEKRTMGLSLFGIMGQLPFPISIGIGESLYHLYGLNIIILIAFSCFIISFIILHFLKEEHKINPDAVSEKPGNMVMIFKDLRNYPFLFSLLVLAFAFGTFQVFLPGFLYARGIGRISIFWIVFPLTIITVRLLLSGILDKFSQMHFIMPALLLLPVSYIILMLTSSYYQLIFPAVIYGIAHGILFPVLNTALIGNVADRFRGRILVISQLTVNMGLFLSSRSGGIIAESWGIDHFFRLTAFFISTAFVLFLVLGIKNYLKRKVT